MNYDKAQKVKKGDVLRITKTNQLVLVTNTYSTYSWESNHFITFFCDSPGDTSQQIDNPDVEIPTPQTGLEIGRKVRINFPTLCFYSGNPKKQINLTPDQELTIKEHVVRRNGIEFLLQSQNGTPFTLFNNFVEPIENTYYKKGDQVYLIKNNDQVQVIADYGDQVHCQKNDNQMLIPKIDLSITENSMYITQGTQLQVLPHPTNRTHTWTSDTYNAELKPGDIITVESQDQNHVFFKLPGVKYPLQINKKYLITPELKEENTPQKQQVIKKIDLNSFEVGEIIEFNEETPYAGLTKGSRVKVLKIEELMEIPCIRCDVPSTDEKSALFFQSRFKKTDQPMNTIIFQQDDLLEFIDDLDYKGKLKIGDRIVCEKFETSKPYTYKYYVLTNGFYILASRFKKSELRPGDLVEVLPTKNVSRITSKINNEYYTIQNAEGVYTEKETNLRYIEKDDPRTQLFHQNDQLQELINLATTNTDRTGQLQELINLATTNTDRTGQLARATVLKHWSKLQLEQKYQDKIRLYVDRELQNSSNFYYSSLINEQYQWLVGNHQTINDVWDIYQKYLLIIIG